MASGSGEADKSVEIGSDLKPKPVDSKLGGVGSRSAGEGQQYFRADTLDFSKWDLHMGQSSTSAAVKPDATRAPAPAMQEWEIDLSKLDMKHVLAHGTYGTVYRGVYAGQEVAGPSNLRALLISGRNIQIPQIRMVQICSEGVRLGRRWSGHSS